MKLLAALAALALVGGLAWFVLGDRGSDVLVLGDPPGEAVLIEGIAGTRLRARVPVSSTVGLYDIEISASAEAETLPVSLAPDRFEALPLDVVGDVEVILAPEVDQSGELQGSFEVSGCTQDVSPCPESSTESAGLELAWSVTAPSATEVPDVLAAPAPGRIEDDDGERRVTDELLVLLASTQSRAEFDQEVTRLAERHDAVVVGADPRLGLAQLALPDTDPEDLTGAAAALSRDPGVDVVTSHWLGSGVAEPDEPVVEDPDPSPATGGELPWNFELIQASEAWTTRDDAEDVTVAVIDQQPELVSRVACASDDDGPRGVAVGCELHPLAISALADRTTIDALSMIGAAKDLDADVVSVADVFGGDPSGCSDALTDDQQRRLDDERELLATLLEDSDPLWILATGAGCSDVASQLADLLDNVVPVTAVDEQGDVFAALATARAAVVAPGEHPGTPGGSPGSIAAAHTAGLAALVKAEETSFEAPMLRDCLTVGAAIGGRRLEDAGPSSPFVVNAPVSVGCNDIQDVMDAYRLPLVRVGGPECPSPAESPLLPEGASCLSVLDIDLDGDDLRDRLLLFLEGGVDRRAVAMRGDGSREDLDLGSGLGSRFRMQPPFYEVVLVPHEIANADAAPGDEVLLGTTRDLFYDADYISILGEIDGRLSLFKDAAYLSFGIGGEGGFVGGSGYRCRDTTGDGAPEFIEVSWGASIVDDRDEWEWDESQYRWDGKRLVLHRDRSGVFQTDFESDPRRKKFQGGSCDPSSTAPQDAGLDPSPLAASFRGLGPFQVGMSIRRALEVAEATGRPMRLNKGPYCSFLSPASGGDPGFTLLSFSRTRVEVILIGDETIETQEGIGLGHTVSSLRQTYGTLERRPYTYAEQRLVAEPRGGVRGRLVFNIYDGKVGGFFISTPEHRDFLECA